MSDTSQGPGWWLASDGKWYPPTQSPGTGVPLTSAPQNIAYVAVPVDPQGRELAGWWWRVLATIIDGLILGVVGFVLALMLGLGGYMSGVGSLGFSSSRVVSSVLEMAYLTFMLGAISRTVGNMAASTITVDATTGEPIGYGRAAIRALVLIVLNVTCIGGILDILWPLWDERNQTIHDKAASSLVVKV